MHIAERDEARVEGPQRLRSDTRSAKALRCDRLHRGERVLDAVLQFVDQQVALLLGALAIGHVAEHDAHAVAERKQPVREPAAAEDD